MGEKHAIDYLVGGLLVIVLIGALASSIYSPLGTGASGLANTTANPNVPTWLPTVLVILVSIGIVYMVMRATGVGKR